MSSLLAMFTFFSLSFTSLQQLLVPANSDLRRPEYLIVGGLVFVPLSEPFLKSEYGEDFESRAPVSDGTRQRSFILSFQH